jgi:hypothetical protein
VFQSIVSLHADGERRTHASPAARISIVIPSIAGTARLKKARKNYGASVLADSDSVKKLEADARALYLIMRRSGEFARRPERGEL